jgi:hypothetical protein
MRRVYLACLVMLLAGPAACADVFEPAQTHAVLVGVLEWADGLPAFPKTNRKDQELRDTLVSLGVPQPNITLLMDEDASLANIEAAIAKTLANAGAGSTLIIYYAGHGWPTAGGDFCLANYDLQKKAAQHAWSLNELGEKLANNFKGRHVFLWADCCFSGGLQVVVDALAKKRIAAFSLTSAGMADTSTRNWTFTQSLIDALRGEPLVDADSDGRVTLMELRDEVRDAMQHREGQAYGFKAHAIEDDYVLASSKGARPNGGNSRIPVGSYVQATDRGRTSYGRVIRANSRRVLVQFYDYTEKRTVTYDAEDVARSTRTPRAPVLLDVGVKPDCLTEWRGTWYPAKVIERQTTGGTPQYRVHYLGYESSWDEWVGSERIRLLKEEQVP